MTTIRPNLPPPVQPAAPSEAARQAARAFFQIAAGQAPARAAAPVQASAPAAGTAATAPLPRVSQASAAPSAQPLKPGSILDIRV